MSLSCQSLCVNSDRWRVLQSLFQKCPLFSSCVSVQVVFAVFNCGRYCFVLKHEAITGYLHCRESPQAGQSIHTALFKIPRWGLRVLCRIFLQGTTLFKIIATRTDTAMLDNMGQYTACAKFTPLYSVLYLCHLYCLTFCSHPC